MFTLTLNGTTEWPTAKELKRLGETRASSTHAAIKHILERIAEAMQDTAKEVHSYSKSHPEFTEIGQRLLQEGESGSATSLRG